MDFLHYDFHLGSNDVINVELGSQANVLLMDDLNFGKYKRGEGYKYHGGLVKKTPYRIRPPHIGHWNVVIDLGGYSGKVNVSVSITNGRM